MGVGRAWERENKETNEGEGEKRKKQEGYGKSRREQSDEEGSLDHGPWKPGMGTDLSRDVKMEKI